MCGRGEGYIIRASKKPIPIGQVSTGKATNVGRPYEANENPAGVPLWVPFVRLLVSDSSEALLPKFQPNVCLFNQLNRSEEVFNTLPEAQKGLWRASLNQ